MFFSYITSPFWFCWVLDLFRFNYLMNSKYGFSIQFCVYGVNCGKSLCAHVRGLGMEGRESDRHGFTRVFIKIYSNTQIA